MTLLDPSTSDHTASEQTTSGHATNGRALRPPDRADGPDRRRREPDGHGPALAENLTVPERLITASAAGVFHPAPAEVVTCEGEVVYAGTEIGTIAQSADTHRVVSPFTGFFMGLLALPGERVRPGQPLAWVRVTG